MNDFKKYLPSEKFIYSVLIIIVIIILFFVGKAGISFLKNLKITEKKENNLVQVKIGSIIQKDTNNNGIADWEEYLWGLDPNKNGPENKEFILSKKAELIKSGEMVPPDVSKKITDSEMLSQEFFATIISLQQTGQLNEESMNSITDAVGKNIENVPLPNIYTEKMLTIQNDSMITKTAYYKAFGNLVTKYTDANIGSELTFIIQGLSNKDPQALYAASTVGQAYQSFGAELIKIPVPKSFASAHLSAANNYEKTGQSIKGLSQIISDPMVGMKSIINYKNYSDALASDLEKLSTILQ